MAHRPPKTSRPVHVSANRNLRRKRLGLMSSIKADYPIVINIKENKFIVDNHQLQLIINAGIKFTPVEGVITVDTTPVRRGHNVPIIANGVIISKPKPTRRGFNVPAMVVRKQKVTVQDILSKMQKPSKPYPVFHEMVRGIRHKGLRNNGSLQHAPIRRYGISGIDLMGMKPNVMMSVISGFETGNVGSSVVRHTDFGSWVDNNTEHVNVKKVKEDVKGKYNLKAEKKRDVYIELASKVYLDFKTCSYENIRITDSAIRFDWGEEDDTEIFSFNLLEPAAFLMSVYIHHMALKYKWDKNDDKKSVMLRNKILHLHPEYAEYLDKITSDIEKLGVDRFKDTYKHEMRGSACVKDIGNFELIPDVSEHFIQRIRDDKTTQFHMKMMMEKCVAEIKKKKGKRVGWKWGYVKEAMTMNRLFCDNANKQKDGPISALFFARAIYPFLPQSMRTEDENVMTDPIVQSIKSAVERSAVPQKNKDSFEYEFVQEIIEELDSLGLYNNEEDF